MSCKATLSIFYGQQILKGISLPCRREEIKNKISLLAIMSENGSILPNLNLFRYTDRTY